MKQLIFIILSILFLNYNLSAQSHIGLKEIYEEGMFTEKRISNFHFHPDARHYVRLYGRQIQLFNLADGKKQSVLFEAPDDMSVQDFQLSADGKKILLQSNTQKLYRYSKEADYLVYDPDRQQLTPVFDKGKQRYADFSPQGDKAAFIYQNNLYYRDLQSGAVTQVTQDGRLNHIINGAADWVYEEEFGLTQAYAWSPDGRYLAFLRFDESEVPEFTMANYKGGIYPEYTTWKYPKVSQPMAKVTAHLYDTKSKQSRLIEMKEGLDPYLPRIGWNPYGGQAYVFRLNRRQNQLELWLTEPATGKTERVLIEKDAAYLKLHDNLTFLSNDKGFLWTSESDGWNHIYHHSLQGKKIAQLTQGNWEVSRVIAYDAQKDQIYYQSTERSPIERHIYSIGLNGKVKKQISRETGWHEADFSPDFQHFIHTHSNINEPPTYGIDDHSGKLQYWLEENNGLKVLQRVFKTLPVNFWQFETENEITLDGWMIKPPGFQENKQYPVLMYVYGGPGSQRVAHRWNAPRDYWWFQMMAQNGYIIACVDNRGTGGRGAEFQKQTYLKLGLYETEDQIEAARYLAAQPYVDASRIGVYGKSYGGYMAALCLLRGREVFASGIALAPVTHWKWYDGVYTERYMRTLEENPEGYENSAPVNIADQLVDPLLLVHGLGDDNVHFQHSAEMTDALVKANKQFDTYFYPNIDHSLRGGNTALHLYTKMTDFLDSHLRQEALRANQTLYYPGGQINPHYKDIGKGKGLIRYKDQLKKEKGIKKQ